MLGTDIIDEVSRDLNDQEPGHEYVRWTRAQLESYMKEAVLQVSRYMKTWFLETLTVELETGGDWQKACSCTRILRIYGESDKNGNVIRYLRRIDDIERDIWPGVPQRCVEPNGSYSMEGYTINGTDGGTSFKVYPPVPYGQTRYVSLLCYKKPEGDAASDIPDEAVAAVKQWMLYRAYALDSENNASLTQLADSHYKAFYKLIEDAHKLELEEEARYGSIRTAPQDKAE